MGIKIKRGGTKPPPPPGTGGGGNSGGGGGNHGGGGTTHSSTTHSGGSGGTRTTSSGGGSGKAKKTQQYVQLYRVIFGSNVKPNMDLIKQAVAHDWSAAYFKQQIRLLDKNYFKSAEAKKATLEFQDYWKALFPGTKMNRNILRQYLRNGWNERQLQQAVMGLPAFKREYKYYNQYARAQREAGLAAGMNPLQYRQYQQTLKDAYKQLGMQTPQGYERLFFRSGLSDDQFLSNLAELTKGAGAAQWDFGGFREPQQRAVLFSGKGALGLRGQLQQALQKQQRYMQTQGSQFGLSRNDDQTVTIKGL